MSGSHDGPFPGSDAHDMDPEYGFLADPELLNLIEYTKSVVPRSGLENRFGKYIIRRELSDRGDSLVWLANDPDLNRTVILKISKAGSRPGQNVVLEGRALAAIDHPNVVNVLAVEMHEACPFLVLENIDGQTLDEFTAGHPLGEREVLGIASQIAGGLREIHRVGLLHLDLKPANVMIERDGTVKIIDFGLARRVNEVTFDEILGTPGYLAPERSNDRPEWIDRPTDIFGLGGILFYLLTGEAPFVGQTREEAVLHSMRGKLNWPALQRVRASRRTVQLVNSCLAISPDQRPQTAEEFLNRLQRIYRCRAAGWCLLVLLLILALVLVGQSLG